MGWKDLLHLQVEDVTHREFGNCLVCQAKSAYLQGKRFCIQPNHAPLHSVIDTRIQRDNWKLDGILKYFEIQHQPGQQDQLNADPLSRPPCDDHCKGCKGWKFQTQVSFINVGVQTDMHAPNQDIAEPPNYQSLAGDRCATVKLEPTWTSNVLGEQQKADADLKVIIG